MLLASNKYNGYFCFLFSLVLSVLTVLNMAKQLTPWEYSRGQIYFSHIFLDISHDMISGAGRYSIYYKFDYNIMPNDSATFPWYHIHFFCCWIYTHVLCCTGGTLIYAWGELGVVDYQEPMVSLPGVWSVLNTTCSPSGQTWNITYHLGIWMLYLLLQQILLDRSNNI